MLAINYNDEEIKRTPRIEENELTRREIIDLIATKILGYDKELYNEMIEDLYCWFDNRENNKLMFMYNLNSTYCFNPFENIEQAMLVYDVLTEKHEFMGSIASWPKKYFTEFEEYNKYRVIFAKESLYEHQNNSLKEAICQAAIKTLSECKND